VEEDIFRLNYERYFSKRPQNVSGEVLRTS